MSKDAPNRASSRPTALDTVALDKPNSAAAREKEPVSATLANTAQASKSGKPGMGRFRKRWVSVVSLFCPAAKTDLYPRQAGRASTDGEPKREP